jgi:3-methyladenine DNA glycosylase Tag
MSPAEQTKPTREWRQPPRPATLAGYLEALSRPVFLSGMGWPVVEAKWDGIREAFHAFDPEEVAAMDGDDVERLMSDTRVIRNRKKIEATITNAERMLELDREHGSFQRYLDSLGGYAETVAGVRREFRFLGESGAYIFLWLTGQTVPARHEWSEEHRRRSA